jgi:hypothetical protein
VVAQEVIIWEEITNPQAIRKTRSMLNIMRVIISKAILSHLHKSCYKRILNPSFPLVKQHQSPDSLQYFTLILTKVGLQIIREGTLHKGKVLVVAQPAIKRFSREKIVASKMKGNQTLSIRKLTIMVISPQAHGRTKIHRFRIFH